MILDTFCLIMILVNYSSLSLSLYTNWHLYFYYYYHHHHHNGVHHHNHNHHHHNYIHHLFNSCCMKRQNCNDRKSWLSVKDSMVPIINYYGIITPLGNINFLDETYRTCSMGNYLDVYSYCPWPDLDYHDAGSGLPWCVTWATMMYSIILVR